MKHKFIPLLVFIIILFLFAFPKNVAAEIVGFAYDPIENGGGARLVAMGRAFVGISEDPNAIFINPAGLAASKNMEALGMYYTRFLNNITYITGAGVIPTEYGIVGLGYVGQGIGGIVDTTDPANLKEFSYSDNLVLISYATPLSRFYKIEDETFGGKVDIGGNFKIFTGGFSGSVSRPNSFINFDLGFQYRMDDWITLGIAQNNVLPASLGGAKYLKGGSEEVLSSPTKFGAAFKFNEGRTIVDADIIIPSIAGYPMLFNIGAEHLLDSNFYVRAGLSEVIDAAEASGLAWGYSLGLGMQISDFKIDYAFKPYYDIGDNTVHYISLSYVFSQPEAEKKAKTPPPPAPAPSPSPSPKPAPEAPTGAKITLKTFKDVPSGYWAKEPIEYLATLGILGGYPDGTFRPEAPLTRAELATVLVRAKEGEPPLISKNPFPDLPAGNWAAKYVKAASDLKLVGGYPDGEFKPNNKVNRAVGIVLLTRFADLPLPQNTTLGPFRDMDASHWASPNVLAAYNAGMLNYLKSADFEPEREMTRAEVAEILSKTPWAIDKITELKKKI